MDMFMKLGYVGLLTSDPMPVTRFGPRLLGNVLGGTPDYVELFKNDLRRPVSITVEAAFFTPGGRVRLAYEPNGGDAYQVEELANSGMAPNRAASRTIIVPSQQSIFIANADTFFPLVAADSFRVLIFDPMKVLETPFD
jgi:hypothetical protein